LFLLLLLPLPRCNWSIWCSVVFNCLYFKCLPVVQVCLFALEKRKQDTRFYFWFYLRGYREVHKISCICHHKTSRNILFSSSRLREMHVKKKPKNKKTKQNKTNQKQKKTKNKKNQNKTKHNKQRKLIFLRWLIYKMSILETYNYSLMSTLDLLICPNHIYG